MLTLPRLIILVTVFKICVSDDPHIVEYINERLPDGGYHFRFLTSDGQERDESGTLQKIAGDEYNLKIEGVFSYIHNGIQYKRNYGADKNGSWSKDVTGDLKNVIHEPLGEIPSLPPVSNQTIGPIPIIPVIGPAAIASLAGGGIG